MQDRYLVTVALVAGCLTLFAALPVLERRYAELPHAQLAACAPTPAAYSVALDLPYCRGARAEVDPDVAVVVFVITRDRVAAAQRSIESFRATLSSPWTLVVCDHHSTYPPMLKWLEALTAAGTEVWRLEHTDFFRALEQLSERIRRYLQAHPAFGHYVVTDPDVELNGTAGDILPFYAAVLNACPELSVIGPSLQISNLPAHYDLRQKAFEWESQFWRAAPFTAVWRGLKYHLAEQPIDTTFAMRRATEPFKRLQGKTVRSYAPYMVLHSDWYLNSSDLPPDYRWYLAHQAAVNHWGRDGV